MERGLEATPIHLYDDLTKAEATALFLLRTQVLGVKAWLASIGVPDVDPQCECGLSAESLKHLLGFCRNKTWQRIRLVERTGTQDLEALVTRAGKSESRSTVAPRPGCPRAVQEWRRRSRGRTWRAGCHFSSLCKRKTRHIAPAQAEAVIHTVKIYTLERANTEERGKDFNPLGETLIDLLPCLYFS